MGISVLISFVFSPLIHMKTLESLHYYPHFYRGKNKI